MGKVIGGEVVIKDEYLQMHPELKQGDIVLQEGKPIYIGGCSVPSELFEILGTGSFLSDDGSAGSHGVFLSSPRTAGSKGRRKVRDRVPAL